MSPLDSQDVPSPTVTHERMFLLGVLEVTVGESPRGDTGLEAATKLCTKKIVIQVPELSIFFSLHFLVLRWGAPSKAEPTNDKKGERGNCRGNIGQ